MPEVRVGEVVICLEWLDEQLMLVLQEIAWPAYRDEGKAVPGFDAERAMQKATGDAGGRYVFGVTLEQVDTLHRLIDRLSAHGDVLTASRGAGLAAPTLPALGQAIFDGACAVRGIIRQMESQRLGQARGSQAGVGEERAAYYAERARWPVAGMPTPVPRRAPRRVELMRRR